ncbi:MAG: cyclic nucleotide-binding domain-containing protein [bacterium]
MEKHIKKDDYILTVNPQQKFFFKDTIIFNEGDLSDGRLYLIQKGKIRIFSKINNKELEFNILGQGEIFGELSAFDDQPRSATAQIVEDATLVIINRMMIDEQLSKTPPWFSKFIKIVTCRLREADTLITELMLQKNRDNTPS